MKQHTFSPLLDSR